MRKIYIFSTLVLLQLHTTAQTIFTYGKQSVNKNEFIQNFFKNSNNLQGDRTAALKENLELYIRYKLKVQAAYDAKLDTLQNQQDDLQGFKRQIEGKYLTETKMMKMLTDEAFQRSQKDVRIAHILVLFEKPSGDTTFAYKKIKEAYSKLSTGQDFTAVAKSYSEDPSVTTNGGDLGYITAFTLPYNLENLAYTTPIGKYSSIYKSSFGYHIFKNNGERKALGKMQAAQILLQVYPNYTEAQQAAVKKLADSIYTNLAKGEVFDNYARAYSNDMYSASAGGLLQEFSVGKYDALFENTFAKLKDGEVSKPFLTGFGWHILKRITSTPPPSKLDPTIESELLVKINSDTRKELAEEFFLKTVYKAIGFKEQQLKPTLANNLTNRLTDATAAIQGANDDVLYLIGTKKITFNDLQQFAKDARSTATYQSYDATKLIALHKKSIAIEQYKKNLEQYNPDFKAQVKEFKDGNLLFEIMERNVWNKSANDDDGLKKYYAQHKTKYTWNKSADVILFNGNDQNAMNKAIEDLKANKPWKDVLASNTNSLNADSGRFELSNIPVAERTAFTEKMITTLYSPNNDNNFVFAYIVKLYPEGGIKSFDEAKGLVINDYQQQLEESWMASLKKKYPIKINEKVWASILANGK